MTTIAQTWQEIRGTDGSRRGWAVRRIYPDTRFGIQAARRGEDDAVALLFEIDNQSLPSSHQLPDCLGFNVFLEVMEPGPNGRCRLCLVIKDLHYEELFAVLAQDVAERVAAAADERAAVRTLLSRLNTWQRFLEKFGLDLLTREEQTGLFAELHTLETKLVTIIGPSEAVRAWRGPFREPHDFRVGNIAIEIKATTAQDAKSVRISNLDQLEFGTARCLLVGHCAFDTTIESGLSLPDKVTRIKTMLAAIDPGAASEFEMSLLESGYLDTHAAAYASPLYTVRNERWFEVKETFPRLTNSSVPNGVLSAQYSIALAQCAPFEIDADSASRLIATRQA